MENVVIRWNGQKSLCDTFRRMVSRRLFIFFSDDISDIHSVSDHSILKYEALSYHGRSLRALSDYLLPYFPSNENKVCSR